MYFIILNIWAGFWLIYLIYKIIKTLKSPYLLPHERVAQEEQVRSKAIEDFAKWLGENGWRYEHGVWTKGIKKVSPEDIPQEYSRKKPFLN